MDETTAPAPRQFRFLRVLRALLTYSIETIVDAIIIRLRILAREKDLVIGSILVVVGFLNFESDKYCDGNTAEYLACTRPSTYYYFDALDITFIVLGVCLVLVAYIRAKSFTQESHA